MQRWAFPVLFRTMNLGLANAVLLRGSRQVGKTTLQEQVIHTLLSKRGVNPRRILRVQFDDLPALHQTYQSPILGLSDWFADNVMGRQFNKMAPEDGPTYLFFDEVQNLDNWAPEIKHLVDHNRKSIKVVVTGSSALRIKDGQDSLAGRVTTVVLDPLHLSEIACLRGDNSLFPMSKGSDADLLLKSDFWRGLRNWGIKWKKSRDHAFDIFADYGGYPLAHTSAKASWGEVAKQLNETVIERVIRHDLQTGEIGGRRHDEPLLEAVFRAACRYCGQSPGIDPRLTASVRQNVGGSGVTPRKICDYLYFLRDAMLIHLVKPLEFRLQKPRGGEKICLSDHSLRAALLGEKINLSPRESNSDAVIVGHVAESVVGAFLATLPNTELNHFPMRDDQPEVDFILTIGDNLIPIEVKYRRNIEEKRDAAGLREFLEKSRGRAHFGVLVTRDDQFEPKDPHIIALPLSSLLLMR